MDDLAGLPGTLQRETRQHPRRSKKPIPLTVVYADMDSIRGIPTRYLYIACSVLSFILFSAGGVAFNQNVFYGALFIILAILLFIVGMHFGRKESDKE
jgi:hypothetical protein